jgi:hypothetical protein
MGENFFKEYRKVVAKIGQQKKAQDNNLFWAFSLAVNEFNKQNKALVWPLNWVVADESMSAWCPRKSKTAVLPNTSYIIRKLALSGNWNHWVSHLLFVFIVNLFSPFFGTEFKNIACSITGCIVVQQGKEGMRDGQYFDSFGATSACTLFLTELALEVNSDCE